MTLEVLQDHFYAKIILEHSFLTDFDENLYGCQYHEDTIFSFNYIRAEMSHF